MGILDRPYTDKLGLLCYHLRFYDLHIYNIYANIAILSGRYMMNRFKSSTCTNDRNRVSEVRNITTWWYEYVSLLHSPKQEMVSNLYPHPLSPSRFSPFLQFVFKRVTGSWGIPCDPSIVPGPISHPLTGSHLCWSELYDLWAGKSSCTHSQIPLCFCARPFVMEKTEMTKSFRKPTNKLHSK